MIINTNDACHFRIALTETKLARGFFQFYGISPPTTSQYKNFSGVFSQSQGGQVQHGFLNVSLTWTNINAPQINRLKQFVSDSLSGTRDLYLTIPLNNADVGNRTYIDVKGVPYPVDANEGGDIAGGIGVYYTGFTLFVNNLQIINNPATF